MSNLNSEIKRKVRTRKEAIKNTGKSVYNANEDIESLNDFIKLQYKLTEAIDQAIENKDISFYTQLNSNRRWFGKIVIFIKKVIRKLFKLTFGWLFYPIINRQSNYNGKIVNSLRLENYIITQQEDRIIKLENMCNRILLENKYLLSKSNINCDLELIKYNQFDYFKFENEFRGSRENVMTIQEQYIPYYLDNLGGDVIDIGSGRGEFLELMKKNGISAYGIDVYEPFVEYCQKLGYRVIRNDALTYINTLEDDSIGGIFMSQVVEHLSEDYISALIKIAYSKLKKGSYFIIETPNPECLAALTEFNIDMSHIKPIHYRALEYLFKAANYQKVEKYHTKQTLYPVSAHLIEGDGISNINYFNNGIEQINKLLFGYRDYTLIAKK